jgi:hypothetical protein
LDKQISHSCQLVASLTAAAVDDLAAIGCFHSLAESMNSFAASFAWLICTFHVNTYTLLVSKQPS